MTAQPSESRHWPLDRLVPFADSGSDNTDWVLDLSAVARFGLRGPGTAAWLTSQGYSLPTAINRVEQALGMRIARLGQDEVLILPTDPPDVVALSDLRRAWVSAECAKGYDAYRDEGWCWLRLTGPGINDALSLLTAADTRAAAFPPGGVLQTRAMHLDTVLLRGGSEAAVDLFFDVSSSEYALAYFQHALPEFRFGRMAVQPEATGTLDHVRQ